MKLNLIITTKYLFAILITIFITNSAKADPELEKLFDQLQLVKENERIAELAGKLNEENRIMKDLIIQLIKDNQKLKTENNLLIKNIKDLN